MFSATKLVSAVFHTASAVPQSRPATRTAGGRGRSVRPSVRCASRGPRCLRQQPQLGQTGARGRQRAPAKPVPKKIRETPKTQLQLPPVPAMGHAGGI